MHVFFSPSSVWAVVSRIFCGSFLSPSTWAQPVDSIPSVSEAPQLYSVTQAKKRKKISLSPGRSHFFNVLRWRMGEPGSYICNVTHVIELRQNPFNWAWAGDISCDHLAHRFDNSTVLTGLLTTTEAYESTIVQVRRLSKDSRNFLTNFQSFKILDTLLRGKDERSEGHARQHDVRLPLCLTQPLGALQLTNRNERESTSCTHTDTHTHTTAGQPYGPHMHTTIVHTHAHTIIPHNSLIVDVHTRIHTHTARATVPEASTQSQHKDTITCCHTS